MTTKRPWLTPVLIGFLAGAIITAVVVLFAVAR